jgi:hypothetical protein
MRVKLQLVMCSDDGQEDTITDIVTLQKDAQRIEHLGLTLREAKQLLNTIQQRLLQRQVDAFLDACATCPDCGTPLKAKGYHTRTFRTLFGTFKLASPRLFHCRCRRRKTTSFRPVTALLSEPVAPELLFMETKWASLVSYGLTVEALTDFLPLDVKTVRHDTLKVAERCEAELGEEQWSFIEGCPRDWGNLPIPDGPITVGIDGGYVRDWEAKKHNFEVIVGGAAGKAAHLVGWKAPCRPLPDAGGEHIRWPGREQTVICSDVHATAAPWVERPTAVGAPWVASKPGGRTLSE